MKIVRVSNYCMIPDILIIDNVSSRHAKRILKASNDADSGLEDRWSYKKKRKDYRLRKANIFERNR